MLKIAWSNLYAHPLPEGHRFPMIKYDLLPEQLIYEGTITEDNLFNPVDIEEDHIVAVHDISYWQKLKTLTLTPSEVRRTGFPLSELLVKRESVIMSGTLQTALYALQYGIGMNIAGGTHHAFTDRGEGFCLLNDIAIAAKYLLQYTIVKKVLVIDLDVHQGNGTAQIFRNVPDVFTFSMHGASNYPMHKELSDLDIALPDKTEDKEYLNILKKILPQILQEQEPDFIFYQSGVDILATDKLGRLAVTVAGCKERDKFVLSQSKINKIPIAISMGGGYSPQLNTIIDAHANTYRLAQELYF